MRRLLSTLALSLLAVSARADVSIQDVSWGLRQAPKIAIRPGAFQAITEWSQTPARKLPAVPRVSITLINNGGTVEGLVLRYAVSAKVANIKDPAQKADWGLPFWMSEHRVPYLKAGQRLQITIEDLRLITSLGDMHKAGFWPTALKIEIMVKPRLGDPIPRGVSEKAMPVVWTKAAP